MMLIAGCSSIPRDPLSTLKPVQDGRLRVGLVALVRQLAQELNAIPE